MDVGLPCRWPCFVKSATGRRCPYYNCPPAIATNTARASALRRSIQALKKSCATTPSEKMINPGNDQSNTQTAISGMPDNLRAFT